MLEVIKNLTTHGLELTLRGNLDETVALATQLGEITPGSRVLINAEGVAKINSSGVKTWISTFENLRKNNVTVEFTKLSLVLVEQLNSLTNFCASFPVNQLAIPYACSNRSCKHQQILYLATHEARAQLAAGEIKPTTCPKCNSPSLFDDFEDEYFVCLEYTG